MYIFLYDPSTYPKSGAHFSGRWTILPHAARALRRWRAASCRLLRHLSGGTNPAGGSGRRSLFLPSGAPIRREYPMGGKAKIAAVIKRENGHDISESMALRILSFLSQKHLITRARSRPQTRRRNFSKGHAKAWKYSPSPRKVGTTFRIR